MIQEFGPGSFFRILASAKPRPITTDIPQYLELELVSINAYAFFFFFFFFFFCFKIFHTVQEIGLVSFFFSKFILRQGLDQWKMTFDGPSG